MHTAEKKLLMLRPSDILIPPDSPRRSFDEYDLKLLADSISNLGIIQPLAVRKNSKGLYELISGERRLRAAKLAGLRRVPCVLHKTDMKAAAIYSVTENLQRSGLNFFEEAQALKNLTDEYGISQDEVSVRLGISQAVICNRLRLLKLDDDIRHRIIDAGISERQSMLLLRIPEESRHGALKRMIEEGQSLKKSEQMINDILCPNRIDNSVRYDESPKPKEEPVRRAMIGDMRLFDNSLEKLVDTLRCGGIEAGTKRSENERFIEYRVRIKKDFNASAKQLKIC